MFQKASRHYPNWLLLPHHPYVRAAWCHVLSWILFLFPNVAIFCPNGPLDHPCYLRICESDRCISIFWNMKSISRLVPWKITFRSLKSITSQKQREKDRLFLLSLVSAFTCWANWKLAGLIVGGLANISDTETSIRSSFFAWQHPVSKFCIFDSVADYGSWFCRCRAWFNFHEEFFFLFLLPPIILYPLFFSSRLISCCLIFFVSNIVLLETSMVSLTIVWSPSQGSVWLL